MDRHAAILGYAVWEVDKILMQFLGSSLQQTLCVLKKYRVGNAQPHDLRKECSLFPQQLLPINCIAFPIQALFQFLANEILPCLCQQIKHSCYESEEEVEVESAEPGVRLCMHPALPPMDPRDAETPMDPRDAETLCTASVLSQNRVQSRCCVQRGRWRFNRS